MPASDERVNNRERRQTHLETGTKMEMMEHYLQLTEHGLELEEEVPTPRVQQTLLKVHDHAKRRGGLGLEGAWRLQSKAARELTEALEFIPPGGWRGFAALAAGTDLFKAGRDSFDPVMDSDTLDEWGEAKARRCMVEAFTRRLVPPATAAGLFILLGIHPAWGVHVAHRAHQRFVESVPMRPDKTPPRERTDLFPEPTFKIIDRAVFDVVSVLMGALRNLEPGCAYPIDAFSGFVDTLCRQVREQTRDATSEVAPGALPPFVGLNRRSSNWRVIDFTTADLIDALLVPAGAAHRFNDGTFSVFPETLADVRVGDAFPDAQDELLMETLSQGADCRVA